MRKENKGITLIALVITIIVLLILAAVSIATLIGNNGILTQANSAKIKNEIAEKEEEIGIAISKLIIDNLGDKSKITPQNIADELNKTKNDRGITADPVDSYPTKIIFPAKDTTINQQIEVPVDNELNVGDGTSNGEGGSTENPSESEIPEGIYDEANISKEDILEDIFLYEIINDGRTASNAELPNLPIKTARITGMNPRYCCRRR